MRPAVKESAMMIDGLFDDFREGVLQELERARDWIHEHSNKIDRLKANQLKMRLDESFSLEPLQKLLEKFT